MKNANYDFIESYSKFRNIVEGYNNARCISILSNSDIEGKMMIVKDFAMIFTKRGKKTLIISCNLANNSYMDIITTSKLNGLIEMLKDIDIGYISDLELENYISDTRCERLSMLTLGNYDVDNYISIFRIEYLKLVIERLKISFDYIIIDLTSSEELSCKQIVIEVADECLFISKEVIKELYS